MAAPRRFRPSYARANKISSDRIDPKGSIKSPLTHRTILLLPPRMNTRPQEAASRAGVLPLVGGVLALDFCNSSSGRGTDGHIEHLHTASDLLLWARHAAILDEPTDVQLRTLCAADQGFARRLLERALTLRDAIYDLAAALAHDKAVDQTTIDLVARTYAACLSNGQLTTQRGAFRWIWRVEDVPEDMILGPITASAMAIMTTVDPARLKRCGGHNCGWLFLDSTKSNNRRWCEMEPCGNRAKQTRRRSRLRADD